MLTLNELIKHVVDMRNAQKIAYRNVPNILQAEQQARKQEQFVDNLIRDYKKEQLDKMNKTLF